MSKYGYLEVLQRVPSASRLVRVACISYSEIKDWWIISIDPDEVAHCEPPYLDLSCL